MTNYVEHGDFQKTKISLFFFIQLYFLTQTFAFKMNILNQYEQNVISVAPSM